MKNKIASVLVVTALAVAPAMSVTVAGASGKQSPPPPTATVKVVIKAPKSVPSGTRANITGKLRSSIDACANNAPVILIRGKDQLSEKSTDGLGHYKFKLKIKKKTTVYVLFPGKRVPSWGSCELAESPKKTIKAT